MAHRCLPLAAILAGAILSQKALAIELERKVEVAAPPDEVWQVIGDFCAIADWHPVIASCQIEAQGGGEILRILMTEDQGILREQLLQMDEGARSYTYSILESPLPVSGYVSTLGVLDGDAPDMATVVWASQFAAEGMSEQEASAVIAGIYEAGLQSLKAGFE
jgi:hypothetical protein